jgi:hypothetical protein
LTKGALHKFSLSIHARHRRFKNIVISIWLGYNDVRHLPAPNCS